MTAPLSRAGSNGGRVAVVGGGIAGLTAAWRLAGTGAEVVVVEGSPRLGGKVHGAELGGVRVDVGAESVLARRPEAITLMRDLGLGERMVHPTPARSAALIEGGPRPIPPSVLGVPTDPSALADYLSPDGLARALVEPDLPAPALSGDVAIGALVAERFGDEVADRLLEPLLGGVYAGHARELSFAAVSPALFERVRSGGDLTGHARALSEAAPTDGRPVFAGLRGGVSGLVDALRAALETLGAEVRTGETVRELHVESGGYRLRTGPVPAPADLHVDAVVLATPARAAARLLAESAPAAADRLDGIAYASMAVVSLLVRGAELTGSGLLVPPGELPTVKALTHSDRKWAWLADAVAEQHGPEVHVVRASIGRAGEEQLLQLPDDALVRRTIAELSTLPGWAGARLVEGQVQRWGGGLPQYAVGHRERIAEVRDDVAGLPGLALCGAAYDGVGIAACVAGAEQAAAAITDFLHAGTEERHRP